VSLRFCRSQARIKEDRLVLYFKLSVYIPWCIGILHFTLYILYIWLPSLVSIFSYYSDWKIQCCLGEDFNQRYLLYKIAQIIALSTVYHLLQCLDEYEMYSQSHIFGLCREFFLDVHRLKFCSSAQETGRMIVQTLVVSAAECLSNVVQLL